MINKTQRKFLRTLAHARKPVVRIGRHGLTDSVIAEINHALERHELVKIRVHFGDREQRSLICENICARTGAELIQKIGRNISIYRRNDETPVIQF